VVYIEAIHLALYDFVGAEAYISLFRELRRERLFGTKIAFCKGNEFAVYAPQVFQKGGQHGNRGNQNTRS
jgi:hypothetical protein